MINAAKYFLGGKKEKPKRTFKHDLGNIEIGNDTKYIKAKIRFLPNGPNKNSTLRNYSVKVRKAGDG